MSEQSNVTEVAPHYEDENKRSKILGYVGLNWIGGL